MKKPIKFLPFIIAVFACFCLLFTACGADGTDDDQTPQISGDVLIVYFSATNNTEKIAGYISDITGGTLFELEPQQPYTHEDLGYTSDTSRVYKEHADESLRNVPLVKATPDNWEDYETVFVGYPIWWGIAAWPVNGFITANDFSGKTVIPFCTSSSSSVGNSDTLLKEMATGGDWKAGKRFSSSAPESEVQDWLKSFNG